MKSGRATSSLSPLTYYCKIPFSKTKANNPLIIEVAQLIGQSPASVAMKLGNFGSFDPALRTKGIKGLSRASRADRGIWDEFNQDWEKLSIESELATERLQASSVTMTLEREKVKNRSEGYWRNLQDILRGPSEKIREVKVRLHQRFFREAVLASYGDSCCVCSNPVPQLLTAGHIIPWANREVFVLIQGMVCACAHFIMMRLIRDCGPSKIPTRLGCLPN